MESGGSYAMLFPVNSAGFVLCGYLDRSEIFGKDDDELFGQLRVEYRNRVTPTGHWETLYYEGCHCRWQYPRILFTRKAENDAGRMENYLLPTMANTLKRVKRCCILISLVR